MSLKVKIVVIVGAAMLLLVGLGAAALYPISRSFDALERAEARRNSARVLRAIDSRLDALQRTARDWAEWDDTYAFMKGELDSFVDDNLYFETLRTLQLNFMVYYDRAGRIHWSGVYDLETGNPIEIAEFAPGVLTPDDILLANTGAGTGPRGVMATSLGPVLVVSDPILPSDQPDAPPVGTLVLGRLLDAAAVAEIAQQAQVDFRVVPASSEPPHVGFHLDDTMHDTLVGHEALPDIRGDPPLYVVHSMTPRDITAVGQHTINLSLLLLATTGLAALLAIWALLHWLVLVPVIRLSDQVLRVGAAGNSEARVDVAGSDELGLLAREFNRTLGRLDDARRELVRQSHHAGRSEMAAGVLHNLRNSLSPLVGRIDGLAERWREAPGGALARATRELADPATPADRRARLLEYVTGTCEEVTGLRDSTLSELAAMGRMAHKLGEIITVQDRFIYAKDSVGEVHVAAVLDDAIGLLPAQSGRHITIAVDAAIMQLPAVAAEPIGLMQVLHNLLVNAVEAVHAAGRDDGRVRIGARVDGEQVEVTVADDGVGIAADDLARIFQRGFTTKSADKGGLGLHWCANTIGAIGGRLWASSDGPGRGATFHLRLRLAQRRAAAA